MDTILRGVANYTVINIPINIKIIDISKNVCVLITETVLEGCAGFQSQLHGPNILIQTITKAPSCLGLFHEASLDQTKMPAVFESSGQLLLSNVDLSCNNKSDSFHITGFRDYTCNH